MGGAAFGRVRAATVAALSALLLGALAQAGSAADAQRISIVRDGFGVPHVYAPTRTAVSYGAGYALAQDRLWQMHALRRVAKGRLSELFGPVAVDLDRTVRFFTYTEAERARRYATYPQDIRREIEAFVAGINAWIAEVGRDRSKLPFEFAEYGVGVPERWTVDDSLSLQDALILAFGSGGGEELEHAGLLARLQAKLGADRGRRAFDDLVHTTDPDSPVTIPSRLRWRRTPTYVRRGRVRQVRRLHPDARLSLAAAPRSAAAAAPGPRGTAAQLRLVPDPAAALRDLRPLRRGLSLFRAVLRFGSNAQIVGPRRTRARNAAQTAGPQVGYLLPQFVVDIGLHGGGFDTTGMTFAGAGPAVLIGRGPGYAWTTTTGASDLTDTYRVKLNPADRHQYLFGGRYEPMECRTEEYRFRGAAFESEEICRTRHGPVLSFDERGGVAYALRYAWFNREGQTVEGFFDYNLVRGLRGFATAANLLASNHNMFYVDDRGHYGYFHPGNHPVRPPGTDLRLPQDGSGGNEWRGLVPLRRVPRAVDFRRGWLVNWNNSPAAGWRRERAFEARDNVLDLQPAYLRRRRFGFDALNRNLRHAAFKDHEHSYFRAVFPRPEQLRTELARRALAVLRSWDGFRLDRDSDGKYDSAGPTILERWLEALRRRVFADDLGEDDLRFARTGSELWQVMSPRSRYRNRYDWLNGRPGSAVGADAFEEAVAALAADFGSQDPSTWREPARQEHYQRLNADLAHDLAVTTGCDTLLDLSGDEACALRPDDDSGFPGDVADHIEMDRGTYNHVVEYLTSARRIRGRRRSRVRSGSVIPPGQNGFVGPDGREGPHFEDQRGLYVDWRYKPMPLRRVHAQRGADSVTTLSYPPG